MSTYYTNPKPTLIRVSRHEVVNVLIVSRMSKEQYQSKVQPFILFGFSVGYCDKAVVLVFVSSYILVDYNLVSTNNAANKSLPQLLLWPESLISLRNVHILKLENALI